MKNVSDLYPPTPMQRVMLLHSIAGSGGDALHDQFCYEVRGPVDVLAFRTAWERVLARHDSLRTAFLWDGLPSPVQVVRERVDLPFRFVDWRGLSSDEQEAALAGLLADDRGRRFDLSRAPLMRIALARRADDSFYLVWSSHHLILDGWCTAVVLDDFGQAYRALVSGHDGPSVPSAGRFRDYIGWIQRQNESRAAEYWCDEVHGIEFAARRLPSPSEPETTPSRDASIRFAPDRTRAIRAFAHALQVTPSAVLQGAWALLLNERSGRQDVVFGATVSGRPPELPHVESTVGSFVSNVPVRVALPADETVGAWLKTLHRTQQARAPFEFLSAAEIHDLSAMPSTEPLFDSLLVWLSPVTRCDAGDLELRAMRRSVHTTWPVTVAISDLTETISVELKCTSGHATQTLADLQRIVESLVADPDRHLGDLDRFVVDRSPSASKPRNGRATRTLGLGPSCGAGLRGREADELEMVEQMLLTECRAVLGHDAVDLPDNFFEVGGTSLQAVQVHAQIEKVMGRSIPFLSMFQSPSLREMAAFLTDREWPVRAEMVRAVQPRGSRTPLFCLSSPEVNSIGYVLLARHLDPDQPVYLVQAPPGTDRVLRTAITQLPSLAPRYLDAIRETQPEGPYRLIGMCEGGLLAFEVAKKLRDEGDEVEFVGLLNTYSLNTLSWRNYLRRGEGRLRYYAGRLAGFRRLGWKEKRGEVERVLRRRLRSLGSAFSRRPEPGDEAGGSGEVNGTGASVAVPTLESIEREWQSLDWPGDAPTSPHYPGTVTVFRIRRQPYFRIRDEALGWRQHAASVKVVHLETRAQSSPKPDRREWREAHLDILREPDVRQTAAAVTARLD